MTIEAEIQQLAYFYRDQLAQKMTSRQNEMSNEDQSHHLIYRLLGVSEQEGQLIDLYQNKGRFLYRYAGTFLQEITKLCFLSRFPNAQFNFKIINTQGQRPRTFEIDCLIDSNAYEIKWRDATTDGDHINKEHQRLQAIADAGYQPIRLMFYSPNRSQAIKIQAVLETLYKGVNGLYYQGEAAWQYLAVQTGVDLKAILEIMVNEQEQ